MNQTRTPIVPGIYRHYKGNEYEVIGIGHHSETLEEVVIYRALYTSTEYGKNALWVRPAKMFFETVEINGEKLPRFTLISANSSAG